MNTRRFVQTAILLGLDLLAFGVLYGMFGLDTAIAVTLATKAMGILMVVSQLRRYLRLRQTTRMLNEKLRQRHGNPDFVLEETDMAGLKDLMFTGIYSHVAVFVLIPGPLSDIVGTLLVFPPTREKILGSFMKLAADARAKRLAAG